MMMLSTVVTKYMVLPVVTSMLRDIQQKSSVYYETYFLNSNN